MTGWSENVTTVRTPVHRYVIDVNRDPSGASLYPGQNTTGLCPLTDFDGRRSIATARNRRGRDRDPPRRLSRALSRRAARRTGRVRPSTAPRCSMIATRSGRRSRSCSTARCPISTSAPISGATCDPAIERGAATSAAAPGYSHGAERRFKGGWTTRHYGRPPKGCTRSRWNWRSRLHADEAPPWAYDPARAARAARASQGHSRNPVRLEAR
jgi:N-formylglutamate deformylase